jgi:hypothetical protein
MRAQRLYALVFLLFASSAAAIEPMTCRNGYFPQAERFFLARVTGKKSDKAFFFSDETGCPGKDSCRTKAYVLPGDEVLVNQTAEGWVCAWYAGKKYETVGWLKASQVELLPAPGKPALLDWIGTWRYYDASGFIKIAAAEPGKLEASGEAFWHGGPSGEVVHTGEMSGTAAPTGNRLILREDPQDDDFCIVNLTLLGRYLIAADNQRCGGMNVSFTNVYTRIAK